MIDIGTKVKIAKSTYHPSSKTTEHIGEIGTIIGIDKQDMTACIDFGNGVAYWYKLTDLVMEIFPVEIIVKETAGSQTVVKAAENMVHLTFDTSETLDIENGKTEPARPLSEEFYLSKTEALAIASAMIVVANSL